MQELHDLKQSENTAHYFVCNCPDMLKNGKDGLFHLVPIHCSITRLDILVDVAERIRCLKQGRESIMKRIKELRVYYKKL